MRTGVLLLILVLVVPGCIQYIPIAEIKTRPQDYQGKNVLIKGEVVETLSIPFVDKGMYQLDDDTDKIWVITQKRMPFRGEKVVVEGEVKTGFTIRGKTFGIVIAESGDS